VPRRPYSKEIRRWRKTFGCQLRRLREPFFTQDELAIKLNVDRTTFAKWELGKHAPSLPDLKKLLPVFRGIERLQDARSAYRLVWFLRYEKWYAEAAIRAMLLEIFAELPEDWNSLHTLYGQVPPLSPAHYVPRTDLLGALKNQLVGAESGSIVVGLLGMGGIGKTTLLKALGGEPEIWGRFDLLLWAEIGPDASSPHIRTWLHRWAELLDVPVVDRPTLGALTDALRERLADSSVLVLLDDVWNAEVIRPLLITGAQGSVVITTRSKAVLEGLDAGAISLTVSPLTGDQAQRLVANVIGRDLYAWEEPDFGAICRLLEGLPLAINLIAPWIGEQGCNWTLRALQSYLHRLSLLERDGQPTRYDSVRLAFALSYEQLEAQGRPELQTWFRSLGVFADAPFSVMAAAALCPRSDLCEAEQALSRLHRLSLVQREEMAKGAYHFRLHRLLHDFARELLEGQEEEMDQTQKRYIDHQIQRAELLSQRLNTAGDQLGQVLREFDTELPHLTQAFQYGLAQQYVRGFSLLLDYCFDYLSIRGHESLLEQWIEQLDVPLEAIETQDSALWDENRAWFAIVHLHRGRFSLMQQDPLSSLADLMLAAAYLEDPVRKALAWAMMARTYLDLGMLDKAREHLALAEEAQRALQAPEAVEGALALARADVAQASGGTQQTILKAHQTAIDSFQASGTRAAELAERYRLIQRYLNYDEPEHALAEAKDVARLARQVDLFELSYDCLEMILSAAFLELDEASAKEWLLEFDAVAEHLGTPKALGSLWRFRAMMAGLQQDWDAALACLKKSSQIRLESRNELEWVQTQEEMAGLYRDLGRSQDAEEILEALRRKVGYGSMEEAELIRHPALVADPDAPC
jgi:transcriptional regulator with XRE-family HTH domain